MERILALIKYCSEYHFCLVLENAIINLVLSGLRDLVQNTAGELLCINSKAGLLSLSIAYCSGRAGQIDPECWCSFFFCFFFLKSKLPKNEAMSKIQSKKFQKNPFGCSLEDKENPTILHETKQKKNKPLLISLYELISCALFQK